MLKEIPPVYHLIDHRSPEQINKSNDYLKSSKQINQIVDNAIDPSLIGQIKRELAAGIRHFKR